MFANIEVFCPIFDATPKTGSICSKKFWIDLSELTRLRRVYLPLFIVSAFFWNIFRLQKWRNLYLKINNWITLWILSVFWLLKQIFLIFKAQIIGLLLNGLKFTLFLMGNANTAHCWLSIIAIFIRTYQQHFCGELFCPEKIINVEIPWIS